MFFIFHMFLCLKNIVLPRVTFELVNIMWILYPQGNPQTTPSFPSSSRVSQANMASEPNKKRKIDEPVLPG